MIRSVAPARRACVWLRAPNCPRATALTAASTSRAVMADKCAQSLRQEREPAGHPQRNWRRPPTESVGYPPPERKAAATQRNWRRPPTESVGYPPPERRGGRADGGRWPRKGKAQPRWAT